MEEQSWTPITCEGRTKPVKYLYWSKGSYEMRTEWSVIVTGKIAHLVRRHMTEVGDFDFD